jgi:hypothetical protein
MLNHGRRGVTARYGNRDASARRWLALAEKIARAIQKQIDAAEAKTGAAT